MPFGQLDPTKAIFSSGTGTVVEFSETLMGLNILAVHFGDGGTGLGDRTILYLFDFDPERRPGDSGIPGRRPGSTANPEPPPGQ